MSWADQGLYADHPVLAGLALNATGATDSEADLAGWSRNVCSGIVDRPRSSNAARRPAYQTRPFTGKTSWKIWFTRFSQDMLANGWNNEDALGALQTSLRDGPGEEALLAFHQYGDGSYTNLVEICALMLGKLAGGNPMQAFSSRTQKKDESHRPLTNPC